MQLLWRARWESPQASPGRPPKASAYENDVPGWSYPRWVNMTIDRSRLRAVRSNLVKLVLRIRKLSDPGETATADTSPPRRIELRPSVRGIVDLKVTSN